MVHCVVSWHITACKPAKLPSCTLRRFTGLFCAYQFLVLKYLFVIFLSRLRAADQVSGSC